MNGLKIEGEMFDRSEQKIGRWITRFDGSLHYCSKCGWLADNPTGSVPTPLDEFDIKEGEVIGNIHDNPELMEKK